MSESKVTFLAFNRANGKVYRQALELIKSEIAKGTTKLTISIKDNEQQQEIEKLQAEITKLKKKNNYGFKLVHEIPL